MFYPQWLQTPQECYTINFKEKAYKEGNWHKWRNSGEHLIKLLADSPATALDVNIDDVSKSFS